MDFFISPAYEVPPMRMSFLAKLRMTKAAELVPSDSGMAWKAGAKTTVYSGACLARRSGSSSRMNMLRANIACQARSVTIRSGILYCGSAPA
jgi:hypothetical protein